jgi:hypothetical protein
MTKKSIKPSTLQATYSVSLMFDVEEIEKDLNIKWEDVEEWFVKYTGLKLKMKNGDTLDLDRDFDMNHYTDWKWPEEEMELDKKGFPINEKVSND